MTGSPPTSDRSSIKVLVVDDDPDMRELIRVILQDGHDVIEAGDAQDALSAVENLDPDVLLLDLNLGGGPDGFFVLEQIRSREPDLPVVILSQYNETESIVRAMKGGAAHYIEKPPRQDELLERLRIAMRDRRRSLLLESHRLAGSPQIVGSSPGITEMISLIRAASRSDIPVLLLGETGTGKGLAARCVHEWGTKSKGPYRDVNVAGLPSSVLDSELFGHERGAFTGAERRHRGLFELGAEGSLLLDEIGDLPLECQVKLLQVVEAGRFRRVGGEEDLQTNARILAATHRDLGELISAGTFRQDLYHRLAGLVIRIPPLREHAEDIPDLARAFLGEDAAVSEVALRNLRMHSWPGNVRELQQVLRRASLFAGDATIDTEHLSLDATDVSRSGTGDLDPAILELPYAEASKAAATQFQRIYLGRLIDQCDGNVSRAARESGMSRAHLHNLIKELGLNDPNRSRED